MWAGVAAAVALGLPAEPASAPYPAPEYAGPGAGRKVRALSPLSSYPWRDTAEPAKGTN